jgi:hypothetical protein
MSKMLAKQMNVLFCDRHIKMSHNEILCLCVY